MMTGARIEGPRFLADPDAAAAVTSNRFSVLDTLTGTELAAASATRWDSTVGVGWDGLFNTGRSVRTMG